MNAAATKTLFQARLLHLLNREPRHARAATMMHVAHMLMDAGLLEGDPRIYSPEQFVLEAVERNARLGRHLGAVDTVRVRLAQTAEDLVSGILPQESVAA